MKALVINCSPVRNVATDSIVRPVKENINDAEPMINEIIVFGSKILSYEGEN